MKVCIWCKEEKELTEFGIDNAKKDKTATLCYSCGAKKSALRKKKPQAFIIKYLNENPCVECGYSNIVALEFDHIKRKGKNNNIGVLVNNGVKIKKIKKELKKCQVLCSNCHSIKTNRENNSYRHKYVLEKTKGYKL